VSGQFHAPAALPPGRRHNNLTLITVEKTAGLDLQQNRFVPL